MFCPIGMYNWSMSIKTKIKPLKIFDYILWVCLWTLYSIPQIVFLSLRLITFIED